MALRLNNAMTFCENQHGNAVLEKLKLQWELNRYCDVVLHVAGELFHAHRCVLSACSPFFDSLFKARKIVKEQLTISSESASVFRNLLLYIYTGTVIVDTESVSELLKLANKLLIARLKDYCAEYLTRSLDAKNCLTVLEMANRFNLGPLKKSASLVVADNLQFVVDGPEILELSLLRLQNFIKCPDWVLSDEQIFSLTTSWVYNDMEAREATLRSLLIMVSWEAIDAADVLHLMRNHPLYACFYENGPLQTVLDVLSEQGLLQTDKYQSLVELKDSSLQDSALEVDNDRFLNLAISAAIDECHDGGSLSKLGKGNISFNLLNDSNFENYFSEKEFAFQEDQDATLERKKDHSGKLVESRLRKELFEVLHPNSMGVGSTSLGESQNLDEQRETGTRQKCLQSNAAGIQVCVENACLGKPKLDVYLSQNNRMNEGGIHGESELSLDKFHPKGKFMKKVGSTLPPKKSCTGKIEDKEAVSEVKLGFHKVLQTVSEDNNQLNARTTSAHYSAGLHGELCDWNVKRRASHDSLRLVIENCEVQQNDDSEQRCDSLPQGSKEEFFAETRQLRKSPSLLDVHVSQELKEVGHQGETCTNKDASNEISSHLENCDLYSSEAASLTVTNSDESGGLKVNSLPSPNYCHPKNNDYRNISNSISSSVDPYPWNSYDWKSLKYAEYMSNTSNSGEIGQENFESMASSEMPVTCHGQLDLGHQSIASDLTNSFKNDLYDLHCEKPLSSASPQDLTLTNVESEAQNSQRAEKIGLIRQVIEDHMEGTGLSECTGQIPPESVTPAGSTFPAQASNTEGVFEDHKCTNGTEILRDPAFNADNTFLHSDQTHNIKRKVNIRPHLCEVCSTTFSKSKEYFKHLKEEHYPGPPHVCKECGKKFAKIYHFLDHLRIHSNEREHKCDQCGFSSNRKANLKAHILCHSSQKPFHCNICDHSFTRKSILDNHMTSHSKLRPVVCATCGLTFKTKDSLQLHSKKHSGDVFTCQYPNCAYTTVKKSHMTSHLENHGKTLKYGCDQCDMKFITRPYLLRHLKKHSLIKERSCHYCDYSCSRIDVLKAHIRRKHAETKPTPVLAKRTHLRKKDAMFSHKQSFLKENCAAPSVDRVLLPPIKLHLFSGVDPSFYAFQPDELSVAACDIEGPPIAPPGDMMATDMQQYNNG